MRFLFTMFIAVRNRIVRKVTLSTAGKVNVWERSFYNHMNFLQR